MLGNATKAILGFIATMMVAIFVFALAGSISSGFAGFYGGLPFFLIVIFVIGLATYDYLDECLGIGDRLKFYFQLGGVLFCGAAFTYGAWGTSLLFAEKGEILIRSRFYGNYTMQAIYLEVFWMVFAFLVAAVTVVIAMRMIGRQRKA